MTVLAYPKRVLGRVSELVVAGRLLRPEPPADWVALSARQVILHIHARSGSLLRCCHAFRVAIG
jgi:hypothetical protein